jgi:hypothetical protein
MATKQRKIEVHRLTISGLPEGTAYGQFLRNLRGRTRPVADMVMKAGEKSHALNEASLRNHRLKLRFLSYTKGHRPDVLDTSEFSVQPNPLTPAQTNVEWTHALGGLKNGRYILLIERNFNGLWPTTLERYLQTMVDRFYQPDDSEEGEGDQEPVTVNLEAEPGPEFLARIEALDRITEATVRVVRPNPGWRDLETELGEKAGESDAKKVDLTMTARRKSSLSKQGGVIGWIRDAFSQRELGFAAIKGRKGRQAETFTTEKLGKHSMLNIETDDRGQIVAEDAWEQLSAMMDNLD